MGKVKRAVVGMVIILASCLASWQYRAPQKAQAASPPCTIEATPSPMQGHYTGQWTASGDYHFDVQFPAFNGYPASQRSLEMKIIITSGVLDVTVRSDGTMTGSATGQVDAPIYHDGVQDVSGGQGTISGEISGVFSGSGSVIVLSHPVIDMHWGTFGGHAVETFPTMPDFQLAVSSLDCVTSTGTLAGSGFPEMSITNDSTGQFTRAPGVGTAAGTWQLTSDSNQEFQQRSQDVAQFIDQANALLRDPSVTFAVIQSQIVQPLTALETDLRARPAIARCLLNHIAAWRATVVSNLLQRVRESDKPTNIADVRRLGDMGRAARALQGACSIDDSHAIATVHDAMYALLDQYVAHRDWAQSILVSREILLSEGNAGRSTLQGQLSHDIHLLVDSPRPIDVGRIALMVGDETDAAAVARKPEVSLVPAPNRKTPKRHHANPRHVVRTAQQILSTALIPIKARFSAGATPAFSWRPVPRANEYAVVVLSPSGNSPSWTWVGPSTSVTYGNTGLTGTDSDDWSIPLPSGASWSVVALDSAGHVIGTAFHLQAA